MDITTLKSSGYSTWATRAFNSGNNDLDLTYRSHDTPRSHDTARSQERSDTRSRSRHRPGALETSKSVERSQYTQKSEISRQKTKGSYLRLNLVKNSKGLAQIDLSNHNLVSIPIEVFLFSRLEVLKLSLNHFSELPLAISRLRSLKFLYLDENKLKFLPETLPNCINLVEINLTKNKLAALPTGLGMLRNLRVLRLGQNDFECLPHEIGSLDNLRYLDVQSNNLWFLPFSIGKLHKMKYLNLSNNRFEHLPLPVCKLTALKTLTIRGNHLMNLLPDFDNLTQLCELNLAFNNFEMIPQSIFRLKNLCYLNFAGNQLQSVPNTLSTLRSLHVLHLQGNQIDYIPDNFANLQYLNVAQNKLYNFSVVNMKGLKSLNANNNFLENIPMGLYSLTKVQSVRLNTNQIRYISADIANLTKLRTLDLGNNMLLSVPQILQQFDQLDYFNVQGNNISTRMTLHNGEITSQTDFYKRKRMYQSQQMGRERKRRMRHSVRGQRSRSLDHSTMSRSSTVPYREDVHKMWDSADLLENGFSSRHLNTTSNAAFLNKSHPNSNRTEKSNHSNTIGDSISMLNSFNTSKSFLAHEAALLPGGDASFSNVPMTTTDYQLLGICNQVEMLLNKQLLQPVLSLKGNKMGKSFSDKAIRKTESGLWRISDDKSNSLPPNTVTMTTETFTVTPQGGWLTSSHDNNISIFLPPKAVSNLLQTQMRILRIKPERMSELRGKSRLISNILSLGPIVYLNNVDTGDFNQQVTITIPAPQGESRGGHLHLLTIREDNSCTPASSGFQHKNGYIVVKAWSLAGKAAVLTRAKCKYKACSSMESLLHALVTSTGQE